MKGPQKCKFKHRWFRNEASQDLRLASGSPTTWAASSQLKEMRKAAKERAAMLRRDRVRNGKAPVKRRSIKEALGLKGGK